MSTTRSRTNSSGSKTSKKSTKSLTKKKKPQPKKPPKRVVSQKSRKKEVRGGVSAKKIMKARVPSTSSRQKRSTRTKKVTCGQCFNIVLRKDTTATETGKLVCKSHKVQGTAKDLRLFGWYVLQVEPGKDARAKKDLGRLVRINNLERYVKKVFSPKKLKEIEFRRPGKTLLKGFKPDFPEARTEGTNKLFELAGYVRDCKNPASLPTQDEIRQKYKLSFHRNDKHGWMWKIREIDQSTPVEKKLVSAKKFPGYLIIKMNYNPETEAIMKKVKFSWGLLIRPIVDDIIVKVTKSKLHGWIWRVKLGKKGATVAKGYAGDKGTAKARGELRAGEVDVRKPTPMKEEEADRLLSELEENKRKVEEYAKRKEEEEKPLFSVGDRVIGIDGPFKNCSGKVVSITSENPIAVTVETSIMNTAVTVLFTQSQLKKL